MAVLSQQNIPKLAQTRGPETGEDLEKTGAKTSTHALILKKPRTLRRKQKAQHDA
tara:strand:+ start:360 stop:524 length:165 start_codon:yes stop_codon:yes gene_type:complete